MKMLKSSLFILAVLVASVAAISSTQAKKAISRTFATTFVQYDCVNGTEANPVVLTNPQGDLIFLTEGDAQAICPDDQTTIICAAEYEITAAGGPEQPLKVISGKLQFNPSFPGGVNAARDHRVLQVYECPLP